MHVWRARLDGGFDPAMAYTILSDDERGRAGRYRFERDRRRFVLRRALLRTILGWYARRDPKALGFRDYMKRKPAVIGQRDLRFSVSSSRDVALYAVALVRPVGVDIEYLAPNSSCLMLADRLFAPGEIAELRSLPPALQPTAFYQYWTRKEAFLKATGSGLSRPLDSFEVSRRAEDRPVLVHDRTNGEARRWLLAEVIPGPEYVGAIASEGADWNFSCWEAPELGQPG